MERDAKHALGISSKRILRSGMKTPLLKFDGLDAYFPALKRWVSGYRVLTSFHPMQRWKEVPNLASFLMLAEIKKDA